GESIHNFETVRLRKDGTRIDISATISPIRNSSGTVVGASKIARDISQRRKVEETLREQARLLDLSQVMVRDLGGLITFWSEGAEKLYGYPKKDTIGRISHEILSTQFPAPIKQIEAQLLETGSWEGELTHRKSDGSSITVASVWLLHKEPGKAPKV